MSMYDFIGEDLEIKYQRTPKFYRPGDLKEQFAPMEEVRGKKLGNSRYRTFWKRVKGVFELNRLYPYHEIREYYMDNYRVWGNNNVPALGMLGLWRYGRVRRFISKKSDNGGLHYTFLPQELFKRPDLWEPVVPPIKKYKDWLSDEEVRMVRRLSEEGLKYFEIAKIVDRSANTVSSIVRGIYYENVK